MKKKLIIVSIFILIFVGGFLLLNKRSYSLEDETVDTSKILLADISNIEAVETATYDSTPTIEKNTINNISLSFRNPGDYITFDFVLKNPSNKDGIIAGINPNNIKCIGETDDLESVCKNISVDLTYKSNNKEVKKNDIIFANSTTPINATIIYNNGPNVKENIDASIENMSIELIIEENN